MKALSVLKLTGSTENPLYSDYDLIGAIQSGLGRDQETGHWVDTYKRPEHPTFSNESIYYRPWMKAGYWDDNENYVPAWAWEMPDWKKKKGEK
jgi:hypothetical protein